MDRRSFLKWSSLATSAAMVSRAQAAPGVPTERRPPPARVVAPGGRLVACCNLATLAPRRFEAQVTEGVARAGRRGGPFTSLGPSPVDFPASAEHPAALKVRVLKLA